MFADAVCCASICSTDALVGTAVGGLFRASVSGQAVYDWYLALTIISTLLLLACVCIRHCAYCYPSIVKAAEENKFVMKTALPKALRSARGGCVDLRSSC